MKLLCKNTVRRQWYKIAIQDSTQNNSKTRLLNGMTMVQHQKYNDWHEKKAQWKDDMIYDLSPKKQMTPVKQRIKKSWKKKFKLLLNIKAYL